MPDDEGLREAENLRGLPVEVRLWTRIQRTTRGCWEFVGTRNTRGYGSVRWRGKSLRAHRVAYELVYGPIPDGLVVMHICDNPPCINPRHLRVGTAADNYRDCADKGRHVLPGDASGWQRRLEVCKRGHPFDEANTRYKRPGANGRRICRTCKREQQRADRAAKRSAA